MAESRNYFYMRLKEGFFDSPVIKVLEGIPDGHLFVNILLKMYLASLHDNGRLMLTDSVPYTPAMLAGVVRHQIGTVERALELFRQLGLIDVLENGAIYMLDIQNYIGKSSTEADRRREYDRKIALEKSVSRLSKINLGEISEKSLPDIEIEKDTDIYPYLKKEIKYIVANDISVQRKDRER